MAGRVVWWQHDIPSRRGINLVATALPARAVGCTAHAAADAQGHLYPRRPTFVVPAGVHLPRVSSEPPLASIYVWAPTPGGQSSADFAELLLDRAGVVVAPGRGYGEGGEGFFRISLTVPDDLLEQAMARVAEAVSG